MSDARTALVLLDYQVALCEDGPHMLDRSFSGTYR